MVEITESMIARFWSKVDRRGPTECWPWIPHSLRFYLHKNPLVTTGRATEFRRFAWATKSGYLPEGNNHIYATCGDTGGSRCANPDHLLWETVEERFWRQVNKDGPIVRPELGPCWVWTSHTTRNGYGFFRAERSREKVQAHRFAWELAHGPIVGHVPGHPELEVCVLHRCDNPPCVNEKHLWLGHDRDNQADCVAKGRTAWQKARANMAAACEKAMGVE